MIHSKPCPSEKETKPMPARFENNLKHLIQVHMEKLVEIKRKQGITNYRASLRQFTIEYDLDYATLWKYVNKLEEQDMLSHSLLLRLCEILECDLCDIYIKVYD